jgi:hypothetical protein
MCWQLLLLEKKHQSVHLNIKAHNCKWPLLIQSVMREREKISGAMATCIIMSYKIEIDLY